MTELGQINNSADKMAHLLKEAEGLKSKLEEERQKLNDVNCKCGFFSIGFCVYVCRILV